MQSWQCTNLCYDVVHSCAALQAKAKAEAEAKAKAEAEVSLSDSE
jgi:hypothetical protein